MSILASAFPPSPSLSEIGRASTTQRKQWPGRSQVRQEAPHDPGGTGERAFQGGCRTAPEIASCTGLPLKHRIDAHNLKVPVTSAQKLNIRVSQKS